MKLALLVGLISDVLEPPYLSAKDLVTNPPRDLATKYIAGLPRCFAWV